jgi:hypothetical protein
MNESETRQDDEMLASTGPTPDVEETSTEIVSSAAEEVTEPTVVISDEPAVEVTAEVETEEVKEMVAETTPELVKEDIEEGMTFSSMLTAVKQKWNKRCTYTAGAVLVALVVLLAVLLVMERQGRVQTGLFDEVNQIIDTKIAVVKVNDGKVSRYDLNVSVAQMTSGFTAQGADIESEEVKADIQTRAMDMLVNTELLKQEAEAVGIEITEEDVNARLETLTTDVGGAEALKTRMEEFNVSEKILRRDIKNELTIQALLDGVFKEKNVEVSEAEVSEYYAAALKEAAGDTAEFPELEAVRPQIEQQLKSAKEQEVVTAYIEELRGKATIEILI